MDIKLTELFLEESFVHFKDSSVNIDRCKFEGSKRGLQVIITTKMVSNIQITNSTFAGNEECISVIVNSTKTLLHQRGQVIFEMKNSSFYGNTISDGGSCLSFSESPDNNQSVSCNITLEDVTFSHNKFSSKGLVFLDLENGNQNISLQEVVFINNGPEGDQDILTGYSHSELSLRSTIVNTFINASNFTGQNARSFNVSATNISLQIYNSRFRGHNVKGNGGVVFLTATNLCELDVTFSSFVNTSAAQGGAFDTECMKVRFSVQEGIFLRNTASSGSGGALYFDPSGSALRNLSGDINSDKDQHKINIAKCAFTNSYSFSGGGAISINLFKAKVRLHQSAFTNCTSLGGGGALSVISFPGPKISENNLVLYVVGSRFIGCTSQTGGSLNVFYFSPIQIIINSSHFSTNRASYCGGALTVFPSHKADKMQSDGARHITIQNSTFSSNEAVEGFGGALFLVGNYNTSFVVIKQVTMEDNKAAQGAGAAFIGPMFSVKIQKSVFMKNGESLCGAVSMNEITKLEVKDSFFGSNQCSKQTSGDMPGGAIIILGRDIVITYILIIDTTFKNNSAAGGGAIYVANNGSASILIRRCLFVDNFSFSVGGALFLSLARDTPKHPECGTKRKSEEFLLWKYKSNLVFEGTIFKKNAATIGGAVYLTNGKITFSECDFVDNFAVLHGGHIYTVAGSASVVIRDSFFLQTRTELQMGITNYSKASFVHSESSGALNISNTTIDARPYGGGSPLMKVENGRLVDVGSDNLTELYCPVGSKMEIVHFTEQITTQVNNTPCKINATALVLSCSTCPGNSYSLQRGQALGSQVVPGFQCLSCPFGANCTQNIFAKRNFWGFKEQNNPPTLQFTMCPVGYCIPPQATKFPDYNGCEGNRSDELCGRCNDGYTETLSSTNCRSLNQCNDYWFWPVALAYVSFLALYFTFKPPVVPWIKRQIVWFKKTNKPEDRDNNFDKGYLKILFYFYQAANLLLLSKYLQYPNKGNVVEPIIGVFNFKVLFSRFSCPFPGLTVATKQLFSASHVFCILLMICAFYIVHWVILKIRSQGLPSAGPYIGGILQTLLLGYTTLATVSLSLLRCIPIGSERRLFYDGNIVCFQWWQYIVIAFAFTFVVPFVFVLFWGSFKFYGGTLCVGKFLLACFFPFPSLIYWLFVWFSRVIGYSVNSHSSSFQVSRDSVERVLYDSFKRPEDGSKLSLSWESIMIGRRLILVMIKTFVSDPLPRLLVMNMFCVLFLLHHVMAHPFRDSIANTVETISLLSIVVLATGNVFFASFLSLAVPLNEDYFSSSLKFFHGVEIAILYFVPFLFGLFVVTAILSQLCRLAVVICLVVCNFCSRCFRSCYSNGGDETKPLLVPVT